MVQQRKAKKSLIRNLHFFFFMYPHILLELNKKAVTWLA